jgi:hypothetical protein
VAALGVLGMLLVVWGAAAPAGIIAAWTRLEATLREVGVPLPSSRTAGDADLRAIVTARTFPAPPPVWLG